MLPTPLLAGHAYRHTAATISFHCRHTYTPPRVVYATPIIRHITTTPPLPLPFHCHTHAGTPCRRRSSRQPLALDATYAMRLPFTHAAQSRLLPSPLASHLLRLAPCHRHLRFNCRQQHYHLVYEGWLFAFLRLLHHCFQYATMLNVATLSFHFHILFRR